MMVMTCGVVKRTKTSFHRRTIVLLPRLSKLADGCSTVAKLSATKQREPTVCCNQNSAAARDNLTAQLAAFQAASVPTLAVQEWGTPEERIS